MLWNEKYEKLFFKESLKYFLLLDKLFYKIDGSYYTYIPKGKKHNNQTLQSRNTLIGQFTEKWCKTLLEPIAKKFNLYAINGVVCKDISLPKGSRADLAFCTTNETIQEAKNIKLIFEVKMSIVSNYMMEENGKLKRIGDYKSHIAHPSLLRSDSMLKAIGKAINIRVSSPLSSNIPIVVLGNSPITKSYCDKVDILKNNGVVQGFYSLNPTPTDSDSISVSQNKGFETIFTETRLENICKSLLSNDRYYFSSMLDKDTLGSLITKASKEKNNIQKANKFLAFLKEL